MPCCSNRAGPPLLKAASKGSKMIRDRMRISKPWRWDGGKKQSLDSRVLRTAGFLPAKSFQGWESGVPKLDIDRGLKRK